VHERDAAEVIRMDSKASARFSRISPRKARMIADLVRGRDAAEAIQLLQFTNKSGAPVIKKILESAVANARQGGLDVDTLYVSKATVDKGPNRFFRRWRPRAMGRATRVTKGISHIVIELASR
jgi:large subunit ribosomal protein L22